MNLAPVDVPTWARCLALALFILTPAPVAFSVAVLAEHGRSALPRSLWLLALAILLVLLAELTLRMTERRPTGEAGR